MTQKTEIAKVLEEMGLTYKAKFVPFSQSRNKNEEYKSLNWVVTLVKDGRDVLTTDFMMGKAHCPSYKQGDKSVYQHEEISHETETGFCGATWKKKKIDLDFVSFVWTLASETDVINSPSFDDWAMEQGYDTDSRKAEKIYKTCLELAIKLQCALGHENMDKLRVAYQDY